jgi:hypothetical protein
MDSSGQKGHLSECLYNSQLKRRSNHRVTGPRPLEHSRIGRGETGGELQLMSRMGYDATTFGNHEFDLGPDGLGKAIGVAAKAGRVPAVLASNTNFAGADPTLGDLQSLA